MNKYLKVIIFKLHCNRNKKVKILSILVQMRMKVNGVIRCISILFIRKSKSKDRKLK